mgnify:CR=1 FL=1
MRILGSVESIGAVQGIHIIIVREFLVNIEPWPVIVWKRVAKKDGLRCVLKHVCVCVVTTSRTDETCGVETSLWCNQQLTQRYNMQPIGVKEERRRAGGQGHCHDMACCDS